MKKIKYNYVNCSIKTKEGKKGKKKNCSECKIVTIGQILIQQYIVYKKSTLHIRTQVKSKGMERNIPFQHQSKESWSSYINFRQSRLQ